MSCKSPKEEFIQIGEAPAHWKSLEELRTGPRSTAEFPGGLSGEGQARGTNTRRDFLSLMGFSLAAAGLTGC
ncbi:MAG: TAT-variant-translocated molybdopterin oxidoreductase, partial [Acidobacteriia bacterium]|nr:TAT-variant-translocated molybdopterin oxidoreductase [Terriglobia bacterium]